MAEEACRAPHSADREGHDAGWLSCTYPLRGTSPQGRPGSRVVAPYEGLL